jgi:tRNA pseudouridine38-40 synthase
VVVEGCSRTDKGVHAQSMVAQFYCLSKNVTGFVENIPGKRKPHPMDSWDDACFEPIVMDLEKLMYVLNRMLPHDVKVRGVAILPSTEEDIPFHPTLNAISKTYQYTFSIGAIHDPTQWRHTWHLELATTFSVEQARRVIESLIGTHDFAAFRGAPRGSDDKRRQETESTICNLSEVELQEVIDVSTFPGCRLSTYTLSVTGDRFLYKMMRFLVGSLVAVGADKLTVEDIQHAFESKSWQGKQFRCAPSHGLILKHVLYNEPIEWITCGNRMSSI